MHNGGPDGMGGHHQHKDNGHGHGNGSTSPLSRNATPNMYGGHMNAFDGSALNEHQFHSAALNGLNMRASSPGRSETSMNGGHMEGQTYEQLIAANSSLKTRVSELEVINELFRGRVAQLEHDEQNNRHGQEMRRDAESDLQTQLEESRRRENQLKRRLDEYEQELAELREPTGPSSKRMRMDDDMAAEDVARLAQEFPSTKYDSQENSNIEPLLDAE